AVHMVIMQAGVQGVHIFSDSWSVVNGLTTWVPTWKNNGWKIQNKEVWGKELWTEIWEKIQSIPVTITHVDAHTKSTEAEALHNRYIDGVFRAMQVARESSVGLARWVHQKSGHWGIQGTQQWARDRGIELKIDDIKTAIQQCEACQHQRRGTPQHLQGHIHRGRGPAQIWQMDFTGPLSWSQGCRYVCTAVDTYS
uniref:Uncharacterized protein n=1 Tax=Poecilia formosa TaxID=48698 RepID=A0A096MGB9_POEFO